MSSYNIIRDDIPMEFNEIRLIRDEKDRITCIERGIVVPPLEILIHPTAQCNLKCSWCIGQNITDKKEHINNLLTLDDNLDNLIESILKYKKTVDINGRKVEFSTQRISFSGITGDPMVAHKKLLPVIEKLQRNNVETGMFTNGLLVSDKNIDILTRMNYMLISVDAGTPETYDKIKNNGKRSDNFNILMDNIKKLNDYAKVKNRKLKVNVGYVMTPTSYKEVYTLAKILKRNGVSNLRIKTDISMKLLLDEKVKNEIEEQYKLIRTELEDENFKLVELHRVFKDEDKTRYFSKCHIKKIFANVSSDGNVYACNYHPPIDGVKFGNVTNKSFENIWENANQNFSIEECPKVCDPFKTRANNMLDSYLTNMNYKEKVDSYLEN